MDTIGYYPGCALHGTSSEYDMSVRKVNEKFGLELKEIEDWICCGVVPGACCKLASSCTGIQKCWPCSWDTQPPNKISCAQDYASVPWAWMHCRTAL